MAEIDYALGTHDAEIERLGLQHRVWRPRMLDAWRRAGVTEGQRMLDIGAGPGWATVDLAEIAGPSGAVTGYERSARFVAAARARAAHAGLGNVTLVEADVVSHDLGDRVADAAWVRWLLSFVAAPRAVVARIARALRPGGVAVFHEYLQYGTWRVLPPRPEFERFARTVIDGVRAGGGTMDVAVDLPGWCASEGLVIEDARPLIDVVRPSNYVWRWPASFVEVNLDRQVAQGALGAGDAAAIRAALAAAEADPGSWMVTPLILEVIARRPV